MAAQRLSIEGKVYPFPGAAVSLAHFQYREAEEVEPPMVVEQPNISLFCLDHVNRRAIFVETPPEVDLAQVPFYYEAQYESAQGLIAVPYDTLHRLANDIMLDPQRIILIYNVGRCGSTLVSRALSQADDVYGFSEPHVFTQLSAGRRADGSNDAEVSDLAHVCIKIMCAGAQRHGATAWAFKFKSLVIGLGDILYRNFPEAKVIFLYRNAKGWAKSAARAYHVYDTAAAAGQMRNQQLFARLNPLVRTYMATRTTISPIELLACSWAAVMDRCLELQRQHVPMFCMRYEDLQGTPWQALDAIFDFCNLTISDSSQLDRVLAADSQAGTSLSQAKLQEATKTLHEDDIAELHRLIQQFSPALTPNIVLPYTFVLP